VIRLPDLIVRRQIELPDHADAQLQVAGFLQPDPDDAHPALSGGSRGFADTGPWSAIAVTATWLAYPVTARRRMIT
jgi:hypothetical protein